MTNKITECLQFLRAFYPMKSTLISFTPIENMGPEHYHISDCLMSMSYEEAKKEMFGLDHLLIHYIDNMSKSKSETNQMTEIKRNLNIFSNDWTNKEILEKLSKSLSVNLPMNCHINQIIKLHKGLFSDVNRPSQLILEIFIYQTIILINNFRENYPLSFGYVIDKPGHFIYKFLHYKEKYWTWKNLRDMFDYISFNYGFGKFHTQQIQLPSIIDINNFDNEGSWYNGDVNVIIEYCRYYTKLFGLYISFLINSQNEAPTTSNQPIYPTNKSISKLVDIKPKLVDIKPNIIDNQFPIENTIKSPFQINQSINTFEISNDDPVINISSISTSFELSDQNQLIGDLLSLSEIQELIKNKSFIDDVLKSELKLLYFKISNYQKMKNDIQQNLNSPDTIDPQIITFLKNKLNTIEKIIKAINLRITNIKNMSHSSQMARKKESLSKIINDPENGILSIAGESREYIRRQLYSQIYIFSKAPELFTKNFMNYTLMGPAGSGKTKLAAVLAYVYNNLGILSSTSDKGKFLVVTRADLVGAYIGYTAKQTRNYLEKILEGVLLIDEAYQLSGCPDDQGQFSANDAGQESITEIVNFMDKHIGLSVIIAAGYEKQIINCFLAINEGLPRRFPNNIRLTRYSDKDLFALLIHFIKDKFRSNILTESQNQYILGLITVLNSQLYEGNILFDNQAGDMLNLSNVLLEDLLIHKDTGYRIKEINLTFQKFFSNKGIYIEFPSNYQIGGQIKISGKMAKKQKGDHYYSYM